MRKGLTALVLSVCLLFIGCGGFYEDPKSITTMDESPLQTVEIEGCEYFKMKGSHGERTYSHKGNCKNPIHVYNTITK